MARNHSKSSFARKNVNSRNIKKFILYVEGENTERSYFDLLKKENCKIEPVSKKGQGIGDCLDFVNGAITKYNTMPHSERQKYKEKWVVFDYDEHRNFVQAIKQARNNDFGVAFSNMCIEYWFLLHFENHDGTPIPLKENSHSQALIDKLNRYIDIYNKKAKHKVEHYDSGRKYIKEDLFELMLAEDRHTKKRRIVNAFVRAKAIHERKKRDGAEFNESVTTIYELLLKLGVFEKKGDNEYTLYIK